MGALIMTHSDDKGLVLPPNLAPFQVVIVPIYKTDVEFDKISVLANKIIQDLKKSNISVKFDSRDTYRPGAKFAQHELQGVPLRIAIGPKDLENNTVELSRRDDYSKNSISIESIDKKIPQILEDIQQSLFVKANKFRIEHTTEVNSFEEFKDVLKNKGGFVSAHWDGSAETENKIKEFTKATIRCIPLDNNKSEGKCVFSGEKSDQRVLFAKAY
jgi:prolyl-tRNA synthetase